MSATDQAAALIAQFPLMQVDATPFEHVTNVAHDPSSLKEDSGAADDGNVIQAAAEVKRQLMWQTAISAVLAQIRLVDSYRVKRAHSISSHAMEAEEIGATGDVDHDADDVRTPRKKSEASQPLSRRRSSTRKSILSSTMSRRSTGAAHFNADVDMGRVGGGERQRRKSLVDDGSAPTAGFLIECSPLFESFKSAGFCSSVSSSLKRRSVACGEDVVTGGAPSQYELLFLVSGTCTNSRSSAVCGAGDVLGGVFGDSSTYADSYVASTPCVVWCITRSRFLQILRSDGNAVVQEAWSSATRAHFTSYFTKKYPIAKHVHRVPIYRCMSDVPAAQYVDDFIPEVKLEGDVLFHEGANPTSVYCLVEGDVLRSQSGVVADSANPDCLVSEPEAVVQRYGAGSSSLHDLGRRFILLGEEAFILPGKQSYTCTVASSVALVFRIEGKRFVEALLDDPRLYIEMRRKVTELRMTQLRLDPAALRAVPLLKSFPVEKLRALAATATPRIVERSRSVCTPSQTLTEIMLVVHGSVSDPRNCGRKPRLYEKPPPASTQGGLQLREGRDEEDSIRRDHLSLSGSRRPGTGAAASRPQSADASRRPVTQSPSRSKRNEREFSPVSVGSSNTTDGLSTGGKGDRTTSNGSPIPGASRPGDEKYASGSGGASMKVVSCAEDSELNPALPPNPVRSIAFCLGGDWEGLLTDKWPDGWEATDTVEMFVLPTYQVRSEYNHLPRTSQAEILGAAREMQRRQLGLAQVIVSKLPPIHSLLPFGKQANARMEIEASNTDSKGSSKNSTASRSMNHHASSVIGSQYGRSYRNADTQSQIGRHGNAHGRTDKTLNRESSESISAHPVGGRQKPTHTTDTIQQPFASFPIQTDQFALDSEPPSPTSGASFADHRGGATVEDGDITRAESRVTWQSTKSQLSKMPSGNGRLRTEKKGVAPLARYTKLDADKGSNGKERAASGGTYPSSARAAADTKSRNADYSSSAASPAHWSAGKQKPFVDSKADGVPHGTLSLTHHTKKDGTMALSFSAFKVGTVADVPPLKSPAALGYLRHARELSQQTAGSTTLAARRYGGTTPTSAEEQSCRSWSARSLPPLESSPPSHGWPQSTATNAQRQRQWFQLVPMKAPMPGTTLTMDM